MKYIIIFTIAFVIISFLSIEFAKRRRFKKLVTLLQEQDFENFYTLVNAKSSKFLFPRFNLEYLKLNAAVIEGKDKKAAAQIELILSLPMNKKQKEDVYMKAFNYYVGVEDKKNAKKALDLVKKLENAQMIKEATIMYDIFILKNANHLQEMIDELEDMVEAARGINEYLISVQYENIKDKKNAKIYLDLSKKHMQTKENPST